MKKALLFLRNAAVANVFLLVPIVWVLTNGMPVRLDYEVAAPKALSLYEARRVLNVEGGGEFELSRCKAVEGTKEAALSKIYMAPESDGDTLGFGFGNGPASFEVKSISVAHRLLFRRQLPLETVLRDYELTGGVSSVRMENGRLRVELTGPEGAIVPKVGVTPDWRCRFSPDRRMLAILGALEIVLLLLSLLGLFLETAEKTKTRAVEALFAGALVGLFYTAVMPVQSFMGNQSLFAFSLGELGCAAAWNFLATVLCVAAILFACSYCFGRVIHLLLVTFVLYGYLEAGILSIGMPVLDGGTVYFMNYKKGLVDAAILAGVVGLPLLAYHWIKGAIRWIALALMVLTAASVFDVRPEAQPNKKDSIVDELLFGQDVVRNAFFSSRRNVLLFCLDSATTEITTQVMRESPELQAMFPGFVAYDNNVGCHRYTLLGVPAFMTGEYLEDPARSADYAYSIFGHKSFIKPYYDLDIPTFCLPGVYELGCTNRKRVSGDSAGAASQLPVMQRRLGTQQDWNMEELVRFRLTPFIAKNWVLSQTIVGWNSNAGLAESYYYPKLAVAPISDVPATMQYWHTAGCHTPFKVDRNGIEMDHARNDFPGACDKMYCVLKELGLLLVDLKRRGVYDNSTIVVCSDHGDYYTARKMPGEPPISNRAFAMLWVKPAGATNGFEVSSLPTSSIKIAEVMKKSAAHDLPRAEIERILRTEKRLYREEEGKFKDWIIDADGSIVYREMEPKVDIEKLPFVALGRMIKLCANDNTSDSSAILMKNVTRSGTMGADYSSNEPMEIILKVRDCDSPHTIVIGVEEWTGMGGKKGERMGPTDGPPGSHFLFRSENNKDLSEKVDFSSGPRAEVTLGGLKSDADGIIRIIVERRERIGSIRFMDIIVQK